MAGGAAAVTSNRCKTYSQNSIKHLCVTRKENSSEKLTPRVSPLQLFTVLLHFPFSIKGRICTYGLFSHVLKPL